MRQDLAEYPILEHARGEYARNAMILSILGDVLSVGGVITAVREYFNEKVNPLYSRVQKIDYMLTRRQEAQDIANAERSSGNDLQT